MAAGVGLAFLFAGLLHVWQTVRALRFRVLDRLVGLRPYERAIRLRFRAVARRGVVDVAKSRMKRVRKARARWGRQVRSSAFQVVRRPGLWLLRALRAIAAGEKLSSDVSDIVERMLKA